MRNNTAVLVLLLLGFMSAQGQFKVITWYESWCEQPLGQSGYGIPPWQINWSGIDVIVHFDNENINDNASPYWGYINKGNSGVDSLYLFWGALAPNENPPKNYVDSLVNRGHAAGAPVVMEMMAVGGTHLFNITADSAKTDVLCTAVAQWCERHNYDGVDVNWENNRQTTANGTRFIRILRRRLNQYLTTPRFVSRPWISLTCPPGTYGPGATFPVSIKDSIDMICPQQGTSQWVGGNDCGGLSHITWYGAAPRIGTTTQTEGHGGYLSSLSEDASWVPSGQRPLDGIRKVNSVYGWPKNKIAPAFAIGGGSVYIGVSTPLACVNGYGALNDRARYAQKPLLSHGGAWHWDTTRQCSYISGTATAAMPWPLGVNQGDQFFAPTPDSTQCYYVSRWLIDNGWGGVAPYSVQFDVDPSLPISRRLPGHRGLIAAKTPPVPPAPTAATGAAAVVTQTTATLNGTVNGNGTSTTVRFVYGTVAGTYTDSVVAAQSPVTGNSGVSGGITGLTASRTYYYRVRAYNPLGSAQGSEVSFMTASQIPLLLSPTNGQPVVMVSGPVAVNFMWSPVVTANSYLIQVAADQGFANPLLSRVVIANDLIESMLLSLNQTYYWRVASIFDPGQGPFSSAFSFTTRTPTDTVHIPVNNGWNMVSLPIYRQLQRKEDVFANATSSLFEFEGAGGFVAHDTLEYGTGYWLMFGAGDTLAVPGVFLNTDTVSVRRGWNIIGTISHPVSTNNILQIPSGIVRSPFLGSIPYHSADTLWPGSGYWVNISQDGRLVLR